MISGILGWSGLGVSLIESLPSSPHLRFRPAVSVASSTLTLVTVLAEGVASSAPSVFGLIDRLRVAKRGGVGRKDRGEAKVAEDPGLLMLDPRSVERLVRSIWYVVASFLTLLSWCLAELAGELATVERAEFAFCCTLALRPRSLSSASSV